MSKTHFKKLMNPNYLGAFSLDDGKDIALTIDFVQSEKVIGVDGKSEECMVARFKEKDTLPMIVNSTNARMIAKVVGSPYIEDWRGHKIQIGVEKVKAFGDVVEALRVRKFAPKQTEIKCEVCGSVIQPAYGMSADLFAAYTKDRLGKSVCQKCANDISAKKEEKDGEK